MFRLFGILLLACGLAPSAQAQPAAPPPAADPRARLKQEAGEIHERLVQAYLGNDRAALAQLLQKVPAVSYHLTAQQRQNTESIRRLAAEQRPGWCDQTKSPSNVSFNAVIWDRPIMVNFAPSDFLGAQGPVGVDVRGDRLVNIVVWRPSQVDNPRDADGTLSRKHALTKGDIGEVVVWHELGHNYISSALPAREALTLYRDHRLVFQHLQEYFADLTALHYASPKARLATLMMRLSALDEHYRELEGHCRGAHAIGALLLSEALAAPDKWPSVRLPPAVPPKDPELRTIIYVYEHFDPAWTLAEDAQLREMASKAVRQRGDQTFRSMGLVPLPNGLSFNLMEAQDREWQARRNAWVTQQLRKAAAAGRTDTAPASQPSRPRGSAGLRIEVPIY